MDTPRMTHYNGHRDGHTKNDTLHIMDTKILVRKLSWAQRWLRPEIGFRNYTWFGAVSQLDMSCESAGHEL